MTGVYLVTHPRTTPLSKLIDKTRTIQTNFYSLAGLLLALTIGISWHLVKQSFHPNLLFGEILSVGVIIAIAIILIFKDNGSSIHNSVAVLSIFIIVLLTASGYSVALPYMPVLVTLSFVCTVLMFNLFQASMFISLSVITMLFINLTSDATLSVNAVFHYVFLYAETIIIAFGIVFLHKRQLLIFTKNNTPNSQNNTPAKAKNSVNYMPNRQKQPQIKSSKLTAPHFSASFHEFYRFAQFGQLAAATSHDIANLLCVLSFDIDELIDETKHNKTASSAFLHAQETIKQINYLVRHTRSHFVHNPKNTDTSSPIKTVVNQTVATAQQKYTQNNTVILVDKSLNKINHYLKESYSLALQHIITVIINNAIEAQISQAQQEQQEQQAQQTPQITISASTDDSFVIISIKDNGPGISKQKQKILFTPVDSSKNFGMGVGLYFANEIAKSYFSHALDVSSTKNGTCFVIRVSLLAIKQPGSPDTLQYPSDMRQLSRAHKEPESW